MPRSEGKPTDPAAIGAQLRLALADEFAAFSGDGDKAGRAHLC